MRTKYSDTYRIKTFIGITTTGTKRVRIGTRTKTMIVIRMRIMI